MSMLETLNTQELIAGQELTLAKQNILWENIRYLRKRMNFNLSIIKFCEREVIDYDITSNGEVTSTDDRVEQYIDQILSYEMRRDIESCA